MSACQGHAQGQPRGWRVNTMPISQSCICHAPAMTALHDAHGILDAAQNLQHEVGASRTWTGAGLWCALALPAGPTKQASSPHVAAKLDAQAPASGTPLLYTSLEGASVLVSTAAPLAIGSALLKLLSGAFPRRAPLNRASVTSINHPPTETRRRVHQSTTTSQTPSSPTSAPSNRVSGTAASLNAFFHRSPGLAPARPRC